MIAAIVLAAGESRRMGVPKLLLPFRAATIIETVLAHVTASRVNAVLVVLGAGREEIEKRIGRFPVMTTVNERFHEGMLTSIQKGVASLPGACDAALIVLGDQPDISPDIINELIAGRERSHKGIAVPVFSGRRGHPLLLDLKYRREIARLSPERGLHELLEAHAGDVLEVETQEATVLSDIDTPEDYRKATGR